jgi:hypothetical protein
MLLIQKATGEVTWDSFVIKPLMTCTTLEQIIATHPDNRIMPTLAAQKTNPTPDKFPVRSYLPEEQAKIDADWHTYQSWLSTLKEFELPELEMHEFPIAYKIQGLLLFQHDLAASNSAVGQVSG